MIATRCFPPVGDSRAKVLILGSFPGVLSLTNQQYYAHPRNAFWKIMTSLIHCDIEDDYQDRIVCLKNGYISLWDVICSCKRAGSLDSAIESSSVVVNDFRKFFLDHPRLQAVFFNGRTAEIEFTKRVVPTVSDYLGDIKLQALPSTSPAMASLSFNEKRRAWEVIGRFL